MIDSGLVLRLAADSLWQGIVFAFLLKALLSTTASWPAAKRYRVAVFVLAVAILAPLSAFLPEWMPLVPLSAVAGGASYDPVWAAQAHPRLDFAGLRTLLLLGWAIGAAICLFRTAKEARALSRIAANAVITPVAELPGVVVASSSEINSPIVVGYLRQIIIVPDTFETACPPAMRLVLLAHEQAHVARNDTFAALGQRLLTALLWWNPALHWINAQIDEQREMACDEIAARNAGDPALFAAALVSHARQRVDSGYPQLALGVAAGRSQFGRRIEHLLESRRSAATVSTQLVCFNLVLICLASVASATPRLMPAEVTSLIPSNNLSTDRAAFTSDRTTRTSSLPEKASRAISQHFPDKRTIQQPEKRFCNPDKTCAKHEIATARTARHGDYAGITARYHHYDALTARYQKYDAAYATYQSYHTRYSFP